MEFQSVKDWLNKQKSSLQDSITRLKNKDFLEAVVASCTVVAAADGAIDAREKELMVGFIQRNDALKVFDMSEVIATFNKFAAMYDFDPLIGKAEALRTVQKIKHDEETARLLIRVCCAIGLADGDLSANEQTAIKTICLELGLSPADFGLSDTPHVTVTTPVKPIKTAQNITQKDLESLKGNAFTEAVAAVCVLLTIDQGILNTRKSQTIVQFIQQYEPFKALGVSQLKQYFDKFDTHLNFNITIGKTEALNVIRALKTKPTAARILVKICREVALANDGIIDTAEKNSMEMICAELALDPKEFLE